MATSHRRLRRHGLHRAADRRAAGRRRARGRCSPDARSRVWRHWPTRWAGWSVVRADVDAPEHGLRSRRPRTTCWSRPSGRSSKWGEPAVRAAVAAGCTYLDSTGEPPFIRRVFEEFGRAGASAPARALLPAMGYDFAPGALAGALALEDAGRRPCASTSATTRSAAGATSLSAGTRESLVGVTLGDGYAFRDGRVRTVRPAERVRSFTRRGQAARGDLGRRRRALRAAGGVSRRCARSTSTSAGSGRWRGRCRRGRWSASSCARAAGARAAMRFVGRARARRRSPGPEAGTTPGGRSWIAAEAYDAAGRRLSRGPPRGRRRLRRSPRASWPGRRSSRRRVRARSARSRRIGLERLRGRRRPRRAWTASRKCDDARPQASRSARGRVPGRRRLSRPRPLRPGPATAPGGAAATAPGPASGPGRSAGGSRSGQSVAARRARAVASRIALTARRAASLAPSIVARSV